METTTHVVAGAQLVVGTESAPAGWAKLVDVTASGASFELVGPTRTVENPSALRAWVVPPGFTAAWLDQWPPDAELFAKIDSIGPGGQTGWIRAGWNQGVGVGDSWWLRIGGQPAARFDVRFVAAEVCFAACVPLVTDVRLRAGDRVALWPSPGEQRIGTGRTAVSYVDRIGDTLTVWLAALHGVECPAEPHVDYFRDGRCLGHGIVERRDHRFWYASFSPLLSPVEKAEAASQPLASRPTSAPATTTPCTAPSTTRPTTSAPAALRVGDEARIRTLAEIVRHTFVARVFELTPAGALINAGETDGVAPEQQGTVDRDGQAAGRVEVRRAQPTYALVAPLRQAEGAPLELRLGDEVRFGPPPRTPAVVGTIVSVVDETLFTARLTEEAVAARTSLLAVRTCGRVTGVALLVVAQESSAWGFAVPCSLAVRRGGLAPDMQLVYELPDRVDEAAR